MIIVIVGPTGVGKTKLSIELAKYYNASIINSDAVQIYKGLDIGSAKITEDEKEGIKHYLLDIKDINEEYSVCDYQKDARKILDSNLDKNITEYFTKCPFHADDVSYFGTPEYLKKCVQTVIDDMLQSERIENEKKVITPLQFFQSYVSNMSNRIDMRTGRYIAERTIGHHRTVLKRFQSFFGETHINDDFGVFDTRFQALFTNWAYKSKNYHYNTIPTSFSILKVWLNEAARQGLIHNDIYKSYPSKSVAVDNIYLTEDEITRIYLLDVPALINKGIIDAKSTIEATRDLFIIGCWTGLRQSDLNHLEMALFDVEASQITIITEKTNEKVVIPMHPYIKALYIKYKGTFPKMCYKSRYNEHLQELGRLAKINDEIIVNENKGGKVKTIKYLKYQLIKSHTARRSFATNLYKKGAPTYSIMKLTGHTTEAINVWCFRKCGS